MSLSNLIRRKSEPVGLATATVATFATQAGESGRTVACVATVAVAKSSQVQTEPPAKVGVTEGNPCGTGDTATHADILERHPDAVAAEPLTLTIRQPSAPLTASEETAILAWLALIEESDPATIAEVIGQCQRDADARDYFTGRAATDNLQKNEGNAAFDDDRRTCDQCANQTARRCESYAPGAADTDQRPGRERCPGLTDTKGGK